MPEWWQRLIRVKIRFQGELRRQVGVDTYITLKGEQATVINVLERIKELNEKAYETIMRKEDILRPCILVLNQRRVDRLEHFKTVVRNGDELTIYPPIPKK